MQRITLRLIQSLETQKNLQITLVLAQATGEYLATLPPHLHRVDLGIPCHFRLKMIRQMILPLRQSIQSAQADVILSTLPALNFVTVLAWKLAGSPGKLVLGEHTLPLTRLLEVERKNTSKSLITHLSPLFGRWLYPQADQVIAVSHGIAQELQSSFKLSSNKVQIIYNPVVDDRLAQQATLPIEHPWFQAGEPPVFLAVGRLSQQKDYPTLLQAFAKLCQTHDARLLILGEGELRKKLENLIKNLEIESNVDMPGFVTNPYKYIARATALVLSSVWEVLPTVLIEALACGCAVVSTDCDYGPREILNKGEYGTLVPVGDANALAEAMKQTITQPLDRQRLQSYAQKFSVDKAIDRYKEVLAL